MQESEWHDVATVSEIAEGEAKQVEAAGELIAIFNIGGCLHATSDTCTHEEASLCDGYVDGDTIECPLHQAVFHIPTGKVLSEPATKDLRVFPIRIENGTVQVQA
jgi:nitrite reductase/ring-hydroxylating ferredoxin subunit